MRLSRFLLLAAFFTSACAAAPEEEEQAGETQSNGTGVVPEADLYLLEAPGQADLEILSLSEDGLTFTMDVGTKSNSGQIGMNGDPPGKAKKSNGTYVYENGACTLTFTGVAEAINVVQKGECFGLNVDANGKFHRGARQPALGEYEINTKTLGGTLTVASVGKRTMKISLDVSRKDGGDASAQGSLGVSADRTRTSWRHDTRGLVADELGCFLEIKVAANALDVTQKDECGFPLGLGSVTGIYKKIGSGR
jgi:hypothetical protein